MFPTLAVLTPNTGKPVFGGRGGSPQGGTTKRSPPVSSRDARRAFLLSRGERATRLMSVSELGAWGEGVRTLVRHGPLTRSAHARDLSNQSRVFPTLAVLTPNTGKPVFSGRGEGGACRASLKKKVIPLSRTAPILIDILAQEGRRPVATLGGAGSGAPALRIRSPALGASPAGPSALRPGALRA